MLKTLFFFIIFFFLVRGISRLFLGGSNKKSSNFRFFYQTFKNVREQQKQQKEQQKRAESGNVKEHLDEIEEAEYEDITDDNKSS